LLPTIIVVTSMALVKNCGLVLWCKLPCPIESYEPTTSSSSSCYFSSFFSSFVIM
jgi:hypothetical protein